MRKDQVFSLALLFTSRGLLLGACAGAGSFLPACAKVSDGAPAATGGSSPAAMTGGRAGTNAGNGGSASGGAGGAPPITVTTGCTNLQCRQTTCTEGNCLVHACPAGAKTTVTGKVFDPAGKVPLYNAVVYVPNEAPGPVPEGATCDTCNGSVATHVVVSALSDATGSFVLENAPTGDDVPLVIQVGKWRRQITLPHVEPCQTNSLTDTSLTRLPRTQSEGHIPTIALTTGHSDALECLLRKIGLADSEFSNDAGAGRVHLYVGCDGGKGTGTNAVSSSVSGMAGGSLSPASKLWGSVDTLSRYDIVTMSCEGSQCASEKSPYVGNLKAYADRGGRLFLDHLHFYWLLKGAAPWPTSANYVGAGKDLPSPFDVEIDGSFEKGKALAQWLSVVGATTTAGTLSLLGGQYSVESARPPYTQQWIFTDQNPGASSGHAVEYMTMNTPVELAATNPAGQCGRVVYTDLHVVGAAGDKSDADHPFPTGCVDAPLTPQEKALEFMFFDLSSCIIPDTVTQVPPPPG